MGEAISPDIPLRRTIAGALIGLNFLGRNRSIKGFVDPALDPPDPTGSKSYSPEQFLVKLDVIISESPEFSSSLTKSQLENGETVSDHVTPAPDKLSFEAYVSDTPVKVLGGDGSEVGNKERAHQFLKQLQKDRLPFTFVGGLDVYKNMVLTKYAPVKTYKEGSVLHFTATLENVMFVETVASQVSFKAAQARGPKNMGTQTLDTLSDPSDKPIVDAAGDTTTAWGSGGSVQGGPINPISNVVGTAVENTAGKVVDFFKIPAPGQGPWQ